MLIKRIEIEIKALDYRGIDVQLLGFILNSAANRTFEMVVGGGMLKPYVKLLKRRKLGKREEKVNGHYSTTHS